MKEVTGSRREEESMSERDRDRTNYTTLRFNMSCLAALLASGVSETFSVSITGIECPRDR
jgi:hypothetical protein